MFSQADYALAARLMGLPMPVTPAEQAAAVPVTARVLRDFMQMRPPSAGSDADGMYTGATRSLNSYPDVEYPETKANRFRSVAFPVWRSFRRVGYQRGWSGCWCGSGSGARDRPRDRCRQWHAGAGRNPKPQWFRGPAAGPVA